MKPDQDATLLGHMTHRQPGTITITVGRTHNRRKHGFGPNLADVPQSVLENTLLDRDLGTGFDMLHRTATADTEIRAPGQHALCARPLDGLDLGHFIAWFATHDPRGDGFAGEGTPDEDHLAVIARNPVRFEIERIDLEAQGHRGHCVTNSCQCFPSRPSRVLRVCAISASYWVGSSAPRIS